MASPDPAPDIRFRILNWIGIIEQLAGTEARRLLRPLNLPMPQFTLLNHFSHRPDTRRTVSELARLMQQPQPGITKTVQKMVARGYLKLHPSDSDGRVKHLTLTAAGQRAHTRALQALLPALLPAFDGWSEADLQQCFALLDRLKIHLDTHRFTDSA